MTREEMIQKLLEELASQLLVHPQYGVVCSTCGHHNDIDRFNHADGCLTKMAIDILAKPVIEVGDVVMVDGHDKELEIIEVQTTKKYGGTLYSMQEIGKQSDEDYVYSCRVGNLTLVRKRANGAGIGF